MARNNGIFFLVKKDILDPSYEEYFDFETMDFSDKKGKGVQLSTIDALTTLFFDGQDLDNYLDKKTDIEREYGYRYYISYTSRKNDEEKTMEVVWNDPILNAISKITDNKIDLAHDNVYHFYVNALDEIKDPRSGLAMSILHSKKESTRLNDYQRGIVGVLASYTSTKRAPSEYDIARAFENYKDFRALYLGYKDYHTRPVKNMELLKQFK